MTDTVTRLMKLAGEWADQVGNIADPLNTHEEWELSVRKEKLAKQALQDELVRMFTPLSDEQIARMSSVAPAGSDDWVHLSPWEYKRELERARSAGIRIAEEAHGIGGES